MPSSYKTPGVYINEISKFPPNVAQVETAIPVFIGYTHLAEKNGIDITGNPVRINSLAEYETYFGSINTLNSNAFINPLKIIATVSIDVNETNKSIIKISVELDPNSTIFRMYYSLKLFYDNGGGTCYIVSAGKTDQVDISNAKTDFEMALEKVKSQDEPTLILFPDAFLISADPDYYELYNKALIQCASLGDRFTIVDIKEQASNNDNIPGLRNASLTNLKYGAAYYPNLKTNFSYIYDDSAVEVIEKLVDSEGTVTSLTKALTKNMLELKDLEYQEIKIAIERQLRIILPPGSAIAGIYAMVDASRGVWKAPANVSVNSVIKPVFNITQTEQEGLNVDASTGRSVNALRLFPGKGTLVWGARTLAGNDNEWRYVPVRRFFNMVEESCKKATLHFVFEPNDANTWTKVRAMIENYLTLLWRQGALAGSKPEDAFYVKAGLGTTMTSVDMREGRMVIEIGMAVVKPAEFILLRFSQKMQQS